MCLRQLRDRLQSAIEPLRGLAVRRAGHGAIRRPTVIVRGFVPGARRGGVIGQPLGVLPEAIGVQRLHDRQDPRVQHAPMLLKQARVRDVMREDVFERELQNRE